MNFGILSKWEIEAIARKILETFRVVGPVDGIVLAQAILGGAVEWRDSPSRRVWNERHVTLLRWQRHERQHFRALCAAAEFVLTDANLPIKGDEVPRLAEALLMPLDGVRAIIAKDGYAVPLIKAANDNGSNEVAVKRIMVEHDVRVTICDHNLRVLRCFESPGIERIEGPSKVERSIIAEALLSEKEVARGPRVRAFPIFDGEYRRVISVCERELVSGPPRPRRHAANWR